MHRWILIVLLFVGAHFGASYLVPLKEEDCGAPSGSTPGLAPRTC